MSKKHEKLRLCQTNSPMGKGIGMARKALWILLVPLVAGAGIATCFAIVDDVREEMKLRAEKKAEEPEDIERELWNLNQVLNQPSNDSSASE